MADKQKRLASLKDNIHTILHGTKEEKAKLVRRHFYLADTPQFIKEKGLRGDFFSARYGVVARHDGKDNDHTLTEQNWIDLCEKITWPFAITRHGGGFRLFTDVKVDGHNVVVGVEVKNAGKDIVVNSIITAFGYRNRPVTDEIIYRSKKITPEQKAVLSGPNSRQYPSAGA
ncbi:MAG: hypothetical protein LBP19_03225 [Treponema sp.]|nr:hypothetical protein [Treponema sp.]